MARAHLKFWQFTGVSWTQETKDKLHHFKSPWPRLSGSLGQGASSYSTWVLKNPCSRSSSNCPSTCLQRRIPTKSSCPSSPMSPNWGLPTFAQTAGCHSWEWSLSSLRYVKNRYPQPFCPRDEVPVLEPPAHQPPSKHIIRGLTVSKNLQHKK